MALKKEALDKIKAFNLFPDVDKLIEAIKAEGEVDYEIPADLTVIKTTDLESRDTNKLNEGKLQGESIGEKKGRELAAKAIRKKFGIEDSVGNEIDKVADAVNTKLNKGDAGLQEQISLLQADKTRLEQERAQFEINANLAKLDSELIAAFPVNRTGDLSDTERLQLVKNNLTFETVDGKSVVKKNGEILRDAATQNPIDRQKAIADYFAERKWVGEQGGSGGSGGRGGDDRNPGGGGAGIKLASKFQEKWKAENPGKGELSPEYTDALNKHAKENPDFDFYN